ncbi:sugar phosphate isomerase/epimerase [bacterium]|nr:sugar phosphate isomerase/epimerase [candidate division CSSED10-310 bacterium]
MKIGMMNHPGSSLAEEIQFASNLGFDFLDLTLEPPEASLDRLNAEDVRHLMVQNNLELVGHTAWYLPLDSPFESIRKSAVDIVLDQLNFFKKIGTTHVSIHMGFSYPHKFFKYTVKYSLWEKTIETLLKKANDLEITLMLENTLNTADHHRVMNDLFKQFPELAFHLDIGHANLNTQVNLTPYFLQKYKNRLCHVHLSDNFGGNRDLHLPICSGSIPYANIISQLKKSGYDGSITLEIFSSERQYLRLSREILRCMWTAER